MIIKKISIFFKNFLQGLVLKERCPKKLAFTFCLGVYIAFSPFPGLHTITVFAFAWLFKVNWAILLATSNLVNNPWTMLPVYGADYVFGRWLCCTFLGCDFLKYNPEWMTALGQWVTQYTGIVEISLFSFVIGGNILGIGLAILLYPIMKSVFTTLVRKSS